MDKQTTREHLSPQAGNTDLVPFEDVRYASCGPWFVDVCHLVEHSERVLQTYSCTHQTMNRLWLSWLSMLYELYDIWICLVTWLFRSVVSTFETGAPIKQACKTISAGTAQVLWVKTACACWSFNEMRDQYMMIRTMRRCMSFFLLLPDLTVIWRWSNEDQVA